MTSIKLVLLMALLAVGFSVRLRTSATTFQSYAIDDSVPEANYLQYECTTEERAPSVCPTYTVQGCLCNQDFTCVSQGVNRCRDCINQDTFVVAEGISCGVLLGKEEANTNDTAAETSEQPKPAAEEEVPEVKHEEEAPEVVVPVVPAEEEVPEVVVPVVPQEEEVPEVVVPVVPQEEEVPEVVVPVVPAEEEVPEVVVPVVEHEEEAPEVVVPVVPAEEEAKEEEAPEVVVPVVPAEEEAKEEEAPEVVVPVIPTEEEEAHEEESAEQPAEQEEAHEEEAAEQPKTEEEAAEKPAAEDNETAEQPDINNGGETAEDGGSSVHPVPSRQDFIVVDPFINYIPVPAANVPTQKVCSAAEKALPQQICLLAPVQGCVCNIFGCQDQLVDVCNICRQAGVVSYNLETKCSGKLTVNGEGVYNCVAIDRLFANAAGYCDSNCKSTSCVCYQSGQCETKVTNKCEACSNGNVVAVQEGSVCNIRN